MSADSNAEPSGRKRGGSRRAMRDAERVAEREAYLTGQQPLLTRREMKRLREESEALQAAIDSGEITLDQAKALQNPLAEQPNIDVPVLHATGSHAALSEEMLKRLDAEAAEKAKQEQDASDKSEERPEHGAEAEEKAEADGEADIEAKDQAAEQTEGPAAESEAEATDSVEEKAEGSADDEVRSDAADDESPEDAESEAESEGGQASEAAEEQVADEVSEPVAYSEKESQEDPADTEGAKDETSEDAEDKAAAEKAEAERKAAEEKAAAEKAEAERKAAEEEAQGDDSGDDKKVPKRRPIVRVPGVAQGVRSVNHDTGELEAIKPVEGEDYEPGETPHWKSLRRSGFKVRDGGFAVDDEGPKLAPTASSAEQPDDVPEMKPDLRGRKADTATDDADQRTWQDITAIPGLQNELNKDSGNSEMMRYLLLGLLALVIVLVVGAIVWAFISKNSDSAALVSQWAPLLI